MNHILRHDSKNCFSKRKKLHHEKKLVLKKWTYQILQEVRLLLLSLLVFEPLQFQWILLVCQIVLMMMMSLAIRSFATFLDGYLTMNLIFKISHVHFLTKIKWEKTKSFNRNSRIFLTNNFFFGRDYQKFLPKCCLALISCMCSFNLWISFKALSCMSM